MSMYVSIVYPPTAGRLTSFWVWATGAAIRVFQQGPTAQSYLPEAPGVLTAICELKFQFSWMGCQVYSDGVSSVDLGTGHKRLDVCPC
eukprot:CAMPEP_0197633778 /NCGR_PEP_ID=MMETSP1338-20131121/10069_1 /TAXON_ID=43686 ORGANISM="Pelagodinium beii, Strain RCC1491" /NCGR_SAMPLE_ID=MMETSP1338 /ASSEMBLY_ACC=CAM_ASM_000754 /LENGTH=87 /DNA_ID=CAMNT_0043205519 /DNA_START=1 /DNA_END=261 /DNA_ORIENTATION=-